MFFKKSTFALAFVALSSIVSAGQTPACVLSVIGDTSNPADLSTLCGDDSKKIQSSISDECGDKADSALKFYANTCKANGHTVELSSSSSTTDSTTATGSSSSTATNSGFVTATSSGSQTSSTSSSGDSASASASGTNTASASSSTYTGAAAPSVQLSVTAIGAAVFMGAAALL